MPTGFDLIKLFSVLANINVFQLKKISHRFTDYSFFDFIF
jgi:hypothetical protein